ncbi:MAG: phosphatase PAP2 family protein, partial [Actinoallomurus sp.]
TELIIATAIALVIHINYPLAPPRLVPAFGIVDTMVTVGPSAYPESTTSGFANQFAAMPSLHVGWAAWCGWQVARNTARRGLQALAIAYPIVIADAIAGLAVIVIGAGLAGAADRLRDHSPLPRAAASA